MTRVKQEEIAMDLKIPVNIMDLPINQPPQGAPITISTSSIKRERKRSTSPTLKQEQEEQGSSRKKAKSQEQQETSTISADEEADASEQENKVVPMNKDNYFYCRRCIINIKGCKEYYDHLRTEHNIKPNISRVRYVNLQPDIDDPNFYCRSCERPHVDRYSYNIHLKRVHHMLLQPFKKPKDKGVQPDIFNTNHYCTVCKKKFNKTGFKRHLFLVHKIDRKAIESE